MTHDFFQFQILLEWLNRKMSELVIKLVLLLFYTCLFNHRFCDCFEILLLFIGLQVIVYVSSDSRYLRLLFRMCSGLAWNLTQIIHCRKNHRKNFNYLLKFHHGTSTWQGESTSSILWKFYDDFFLQSSKSLQPCLNPFLDESFLVILNKIISVLQKQSDVPIPSDEDLIKVLNELRAVKDALEQISQTTKVSVKTEALEVDDEKQQKTDDQCLRSSIEMLKNGGKFTQLIEKKHSIRKSSDSTKRSSKESNKIAPSISRTSLRSSMTIAPCTFSRRPSPLDHQKLISKLTRQVAAKSSKKPKEDNRTSQQSIKGSKSPKVVSTHYATCRIHSYDDHSTSFEIIKPNRVNCFGDENEQPEAVIVVLASGQTALFKSKSSASFINSLPFGESQ